LFRKQNETIIAHTDLFLTALIGCRGDVMKAEVKTSEGIAVS